MAPSKTSANADESPKIWKKAWKFLRHRSSAPTLVPASTNVSGTIGTSLPDGQHATALDAIEDNPQSRPDSSSHRIQASNPAADESSPDLSSFAVHREDERPLPHDLASGETYPPSGSTPDTLHPNHSESRPASRRRTVILAGAKKALQATQSLLKLSPIPNLDLIPEAILKFIGIYEVKLSSFSLRYPQLSHIYIRTSMKMLRALNAWFLPLTRLIRSSSPCKIGMPGFLPNSSNAVTNSLSR